MSDPIETKLTVQSAAWEEGFNAAEKKLKHFHGEVESTTEKVKERLESLKESFGRRSVIGEGFETLMGGGAIAGVAIATKEIAEHSMEVYEAITGEEAKRDALVETTKMQAKAQEEVRDIQKDINEEMAKTAEFVNKSNEKIESFSIAAIANPAERQKAEIGSDYDKQAEDIKAGAERDAMAAKMSAQKKIDDERAEAQKAFEASNNKERGLVDIGLGLFGHKDYNPGDAKLEQADRDAATIHKKRNDQVAQIERDATEKLAQIAKERQAKLASLAPEEAAKTQHQIDQSAGFRAFDTGGEAGSIRKQGGDEAAVKAAFELRQKQQDGLLTYAQAGAAIAEQAAGKREAAEQGVRNAMQSTKESQEALSLTMQRNAVVGGEVNKVLEDLAHQQIGPEAAKGLLNQAAAADDATQRIGELSKGYSALREITKQAGDIQTLLNRGVDVKWVTQLAGMGGAAMDAAQLNSAMQQLEANEALQHMAQRSAQGEASLKSLSEHVASLQEMLGRGVDPKFADQIAGMGNLNDGQLAQVQMLLRKQEQVNEVINARKHIEEEATAMAAKRQNMSVEEYKLRQQGDTADADTLHRQEREGKQLDANLKLTEAAIEARNRDAAHEARNGYSAIRPGASDMDTTLFQPGGSGAAKPDRYVQREMMQIIRPAGGQIAQF
jgi:hypothetical protein